MIDEQFILFLVTLCSRHHYLQNNNNNKTEEAQRVDLREREILSSKRG